MASPSIAPSSGPARRIAIPPLENGDHLSAAEFLRRYEAMPAVKKAELIQGIVYMASAVRSEEHGKPDSILNSWPGLSASRSPGLQHRIPPSSSARTTPRSPTAEAPGSIPPATSPGHRNWWPKSPPAASPGMRGKVRLETAIAMRAEMERARLYVVASDSLTDGVSRKA